MEGKLFPGVKKIAVLRANAIGDFVFVLPALFALRETYPEAEITLLTTRWAFDFMKERRGPVDRVIEIPHLSVINPGEINPKKIEKFFKKMKAENFDLAFQLQGGGRESNPFIKNIGAKLTFGAKTSDAIELDYYIPYIYFQSEIIRYLEIVSLAGAKTTQISPKIDVNKNDLLEAYSVCSFKKYIILSPGAGDPRRRWPAKKFAEVGNYFSQKGYQIVVIGTRTEEKDIDLVVKWLNGRPLALVDKVSISGLLGLISRASLLVGNDSGPRHLAEAVGTPNIGIYWGINMILAQPVFRTFSRPFVSWINKCPVCNYNIVDVGHDKLRCNHPISYVAKISTKEVIEQAEDLLNYAARKLSTCKEIEISTD